MTLPDITPTVDQVASLLRTRTVTEGGAELSTFDETTRPKASEVLTIAATAVSGLNGQPIYLRTQYIATLLTCLLIEESYFRDAAGVAVFRDLLMRSGYIIPLSGQFGGEPINERTVDTVMMRPGFTEYDPFYPKPVPPADWPYDGANT